MIIGIDGNEANVQKRMGVGEYAFQLLHQFSKLNRPDIKFVIYLKDDPLPHMPDKHKGWKYRVLRPEKLWTQWRLPLDLFIHYPRPDVFFTPTHYAPRFSPVPTVVSIMDLSYLYFPELFNQGDLYKLKNWTAYSIKQARRILTISNASRNDIIKEYKVPEKDVITTHLGIKEPVSLQPHVYSMNELKAKYGISDNYFLFVGTLQPRKNIVRLIEAFAKVYRQEEKNQNLQLIIIGRRGWQYEDILEAPAKFNVEDRVKFLENIGDDELPLFYKNAIAYVLPSLYEGFGLPVLEAMQQDCPVITSKISSLPEAGGDAALYVNPKDITDIANQMKKIFHDQTLRKTLIAKGKQQVKNFSWDKTAKQTLAVLEDIAKK
jgi:glycosyltransferase involved in cell wall biosynthesis